MYSNNGTEGGEENVWEKGREENKEEGKKYGRGVEGELREEGREILG